MRPLRCDSYRLAGMGAREASRSGTVGTVGTVRVRGREE